MEENEEFLDIDTENIALDLMDIKEKARVDSIIAKLRMYNNSPQELTDMYTKILEDDNVAYLLLRLSQDPIFYKHFPEFYVKNQYGEGVINCQQNSVYHKYGVFKHTLTAIECVGNPQIPIGRWQKKLLKWTMLLHDIGKPYVKVIYEDGSDSFTDHEEKSVELSKDILNRFNFTDEDKRIILLLIKYHDKYLNEGEITHENMKFLANELGNSKELFYLLLDVKDSDARAKSVDVYNTFKMVKSKYIEFINTYMSYENQKELSVDSSNNEVKEEISKPELDILIEDIIHRRRIKSVYQHVIDLDTKKAFGYEAFTRIESVKNVKIIDFLNYAKEINKYDIIQQVMMINGIDTFEGIRDKEANTLFVNIDLVSYEKYINKPRLYDMMKRNNIVIEFQNCQKKDLGKIQELITAIHKNSGYVALDNFGTGTLTIDDINLLKVDYIVPDISLIKNIESDTEKQKFLSELVTYSISNNCKVIALGVENKEILDVLLKIGVNLVQGYYFSKPEPIIEPIQSKIKTILENTSNEAIS